VKAAQLQNKEICMKFTYVPERLTIRKLVIGTLAIMCSNPVWAGNCETKIQVGDETKLLGRYLEDNGVFSFQIYTSEAASNVTALFYWRHAVGSGRSVVPTLDIGFTQQGFKKLRSGSYMTIDGDGDTGGTAQMVLKRKYDESWNTDFTFQMAELPIAFPSSNTLTVRLMRPSKTGPAKIQVQGTLDMVKLKQEIAAMGPADIVLDAMQENFAKNCGNYDYVPPRDIPKITPVEIIKD
jgi:hypothetical protein